MLGFSKLTLDGIIAPLNGITQKLQDFMAAAMQEKAQNNDTIKELAKRNETLDAEFGRADQIVNNINALTGLNS